MSNMSKLKAYARRRNGNLKKADLKRFPKGRRKTRKQRRVERWENNHI